MSILRATDAPARSGTADNTYHLAVCVWGLDLVRPLQKAHGGFTHLLVDIDKFSKWIEVRPLNNIRSEHVVAFFTNIIDRKSVV